VKVWKVILATLVIFAAGFVTGNLLTRRPVPKPIEKKVAETNAAPPSPWMVQQRFLAKMKTELNLTPEQYERLDKIFAESRERMKILMDIIEPEWRGELRDVREKILAELQPEQRAKFEEMLKHPRGKDGDGRRRGDKNTNRAPDSRTPTP
jgi:Spy/CpxP family protein refolding chaperone